MTLEPLSTTLPNGVKIVTDTDAARPYRSTTEHRDKVRDAIEEILSGRYVWASPMPLNAKAAARHYRDVAAILVHQNARIRVERLVHGLWTGDPVTLPHYGHPRYGRYRQAARVGGSATTWFRELAQARADMVETRADARRAHQRIRARINRAERKVAATKAEAQPERVRAHLAEIDTLREEARRAAVKRPTDTVAVGGSLYIDGAGLWGDIPKRGRNAW